MMAAHPNLTLTSDDGLAAVTVRYADDQHDPDGRTVYAYTITVDGTERIAEEDLRSGAGGGSLPEGLRSLLSFLEAWDEAIRQGNPDSENRDLFPAAAHEWVGAYIEGWSLETVALV